MSDTRAEQRAELLRRGLPLVLEPAVRRSGLLRRVGPLVWGGAALFSGAGMVVTSADALLRWDAEATDPSLVPDDAHVVAVLLLGVVGTVLVPLTPLVVTLASRLRCRVSRGAQSVLSAVGLLALLAGACLWGPAPKAAWVAWAVAAALAALAATYFGVSTLTAWAQRRVWRELGHLGPMLTRILPVLVLTFLFFFNAEIWQVARNLTTTRVWICLGVLGLLTAALVVVTGREDVTDVTAGSERVTALRPAERLNVIAVVVIVRMTQVAIFALVVFAFFVVFGAFVVPDSTEQQWTNQVPSHFGGWFAQLPVTRASLRVCLVLAGLSALNFAAATVADPTYRRQFTAPLLDELEDSLALRDRYVTTRPDGPSSGEQTP